MSDEQSLVGQAEIPTAQTASSSTSSNTTSRIEDPIIPQSENLTPNTALSSPGIQRKRSRCDSDPKDSIRPPEKMSRGCDDTDTDTEMEGLMCSTSSSPSNSPLQAPCSDSSSQNALKAVEVSPWMQVQKPSEAWKRDEQFYMEDGSCVILVEDTLFNVHRSILSKDSSSFSTMFTLPQGNNEVEGRSDDNPILLVGDSAEEFRHFLWALYALPPELKQLTSPSANIADLIDIARVANKYSFKSLETWALDVIQDYVNRKPSPILSAIPPPHTYTFTGTDHESTSSSVPNSQKETANQLTRLIRLAQLCQHDRLLNTMITLLRQLMASSVQYAYLAMTLADELDLRALRGAAYLEVMQKAVVVRKVKVDVLKPPAHTLASSSSGSSSSSALPLDSSAAAGGEGNLDSSGRLIITREQQLRLLAGYYRLTSVWDKLRLTPLHFEHSHSCGATWHQQGCTQSWLEFWKEKTRSDSVMNLGLADVIGRLKLVQKDYDRWGSATYMHHDCRNNAKKAIGDVIRRVEEALPDFFAEPGGFEED